MEEFSPIGSFIIKGSSSAKGQVVPLPSIDENSVEAQLILTLEEAYLSPSINKEIHNGLHQILRKRADFGDKVQLVFRKEEIGWKIAFLPSGWKEAVTLGIVASAEQSPGDKHGYYLQRYRGLLEIMLDYLPNKKSLIIGRDADVPGLTMVSSLSRQHVSVKRINENTFQLLDLESKNGVFAYVAASDNSKKTVTHDYSWVKLEVPE